MSRNYLSIRDFGEAAINDWASSRETHPAVATAIFAIAEERRSADMIWDSPTPAETDHVVMAVCEYVTAGDFAPEPDGNYQWGADSVHVEAGRAGEELSGGARYYDLLIAGEGAVTWESLADAGIVNPDSIGGLSDPRWMIGDDVIADEERRACERLGGGRIVSDSDGVTLVADEE